ncbi:(2Fe-2S)-binding protein [Oscillatoriales cyanobacterium USR001]|nr:(2Fe-2S)-binding protein [Oscillatoriales cyanobacterium USR001]
MTKNRRQFLQYIIAGTAGSVTLGLLFPPASQSQKVDLEKLCSSSPYNSQCENYLPGVRAEDSQGKPIEVSALIPNIKPGIPVLVKGLPKVAYLVINDGPKIAEYGINPVCTHLGCTVEWKTERSRFECPCHGSQYDAQGRVIKGPAKRSLPLVTVIVKQNQIRLVERKPAIDPRSKVNN